MKKKPFKGSIERQQNKEKKFINDYLDNLVLKFLIYCQKIGEVDFSPINEFQKVINFHKGILPGESRPEKVAQEFIRYNYYWKRFAHSRKWQYHKVNLDAFEKCLAANIHQLKPKKEGETNLPIEVDATVENKIIPLYPEGQPGKIDIILAKH